MRNLKISADEFAERVNEAYDGRISVVKETYTGTRHQVTAYCNVHKIYFEVKVARELTRHFVECPECLKENNNTNNKKYIKEWKDVIKSFKDRYGEKFSYDESSYNGLGNKMKIHCNDCDTDFEITPKNHIRNNNGGCPKCSKLKIVYCTKCGREIFITKYANIKNICCSDCKEDAIKCQFCGKPHKRGEQCENQLCREHHTIDWYKNLIPFGFDYSKIGTIDYMEEYYKAMCVLLIEYYDNMLSPRQIYEKYNCSEYINSDVTIKNIIKSAGFKVRNRSEATKNAI